MMLTLLAFALTLADAEEAALEHHPALARAEADRRVARARVGAAAAPRLPQVSATASYQRTTANFAPSPGSVPRQFVAGGTSSWKGYDFGRLGVTASQLLLDFGRSGNRVEAARRQADAAAAAFGESRLGVLRDVRAAFFDAVSQDALVGVAAESLENQQRHLTQIAGFVDVGLRPEIDLAQARSDRATAERQLIEAEGARSTARARLARAMGGECAPDTLAVPAARPLASEGETAEAFVVRALHARPELARALAQMEASQASLAAARRGYWPTVTATAAFTDVGPGWSELTWNASGTLSAAWTLFDGLAVPSLVREANGGVEASAADLVAARQQLVLDVTQAWFDVRTGLAAIAAAHEATLNARERLRLAEGRYETGVGNVVELGDAQAALTTAAATEVQATWQLETARARLRAAVGED